MKFHWKSLLLSLLISWGVAGLSAWATSGNMELYAALSQPPLSPPGWVFGAVWSILFTLMGISAWLVFHSDSAFKQPALWVYGIQLVVNFIWSIIFFNLGAYWFAFGWLVFLWLLIIAMILLFWKSNRLAAWLQLPYLLWVTFAGYLCFGVAFLN